MIKRKDLKVGGAVRFRDVNVKGKNRKEVWGFVEGVPLLSDFDNNSDATIDVFVPGWGIGIFEVSISDISTVGLMFDEKTGGFRDK